jgi:hypothetical protein
MTLSTFIAVANSANLDVRYAEALPHGNYTTLRDIGFALDFAEVAVEEGFAEDSAEGLDLVLEISIVVAVSKKGARDSVRGAWCATGFVLGNRTLSIDEAYEAIVAG